MEGGPQGPRGRGSQARWRESGGQAEEPGEDSRVGQEEGGNFARA